MKLSKSKLALAKVINENGGWPERALWAVQDNCIAFFLGGKPEYKSGDRCWYSNSIDGACVGTITRDEKVTNWHQCILSRDEYFTAYPEQPKDEVMSKDWHKNGELPPVGVGVQLWHGGAYAYDCEVIAKRGNSYVLWNLTWDRADSADCSMCEFRPLRTEREKAIDDMVDCLGSRWANCEEIAAHLYENGYRKEDN